MYKVSRDVNFAVFVVKLSSAKFSSLKFHWQNYLVFVNWRKDTCETDSQLRTLNSCE